MSSLVRPSAAPSLPTQPTELTILLERVSLSYIHSICRSSEANKRPANPCRSFRTRVNPAPLAAVGQREQERGQGACSAEVQPRGHSSNSSSQIQEEVVSLARRPRHRSLSKVVDFSGQLRSKSRSSGKRNSSNRSRLGLACLEEHWGVDKGSRSLRGACLVVA